MKKKLALILISLDECFTQKGFSGGGHKVTKRIIEGLINSSKFDIDIFCKKSAVTFIDGINSIIVLDNKKTFVQDLKTKLEQNHYNYILSSDVLLPFGNQIIHSNSSLHKSKNGKNKFFVPFIKFYNRKKIKAQAKALLNNDKAIFTVSESLKNDFVQNFHLDSTKVFAIHPAVDEIAPFEKTTQKEVFTIGSMAGGGLNKGGYLLLFALKFLPYNCKIKARIIFPKFHKSGFYKFMVNLLGLQNCIELLPKQADMQSFYKSVDCYILPSLNEAFGLVVPEAAANSKPSIVSSTTGVRELIFNGENGFVFDREKSPVKNLANKIQEVSKIYFQENDKYNKISKNAYEMSKQLDWKKFTATIIENMIEE